MASETVNQQHEARDVLDELLNKAVAAQGVAQTIAAAADSDSGTRKAANAIDYLLEDVTRLAAEAFGLLRSANVTGDRHHA